MNTGIRHAGLAASLAGLLALPVAVPALAKGGDTSGASAASSRGASKAGEQQRHDMRGSQLLAKDVRNQQGKNLGEIEDLMVDLKTGQVRYVVVSPDRSVGAGNKFLTFPVTAFQLSRDRGEMVLNVDQEKLKKAPGIEKKAWPKEAENAGFFDEVDRYFGGGGGKQARARGMMRLSEVLGRNVKDRNGGDAGEVQEVVVDIGRGRISYVVLDFDKAWSLNDKLLPLPLSAFKLPQERGEELVLNVDRERLSEANGFERSRWPDLNAPAFRQPMDAYFLALQRPVPPGHPASGASGTGGGLTGPAPVLGADKNGGSPAPRASGGGNPPGTGSSAR